MTASWDRIALGAAATLWLMIEAREVFQPIIVAILIWFTLKAVARAYMRAFHGPDLPPSRLAKGLSALSFAGLIAALTMLAAENLAALRAATPLYQANLDRFIETAASMAGLAQTASVADLLAEVDLAAVARGLAGSALGLFSSSLIILFYVIFIFIEDGVANRKLAALIASPERREEVAGVLSEIEHEIEIYLGLKLVIGAVQAIPTYLILAYFGVDGAGFWAILIFLASFIPTIGTLIGITLPAIVTLLQFGDIGAFLTVTGSLAAIQILASNGLEPRMMGNSLNLSPLAIFIAIFAGGALWGVVGALVVVPALAIMLIVAARIPEWRWLAILLSSDGDLGAHDASRAKAQTE